jgi:hypothetical protein
MKLLIENYDKITNKIIIDGWKLIHTEETDSQYQFGFQNSGNVIDIQLERNSVEGNKLYNYKFEIWSWKGYGRPVRELIFHRQIKDKALFNSVLRGMIKKWTVC